MATIGNTVLTLADWAKRLDPDGKTAEIVNILSQTNMILDDMLFKEGNLPTGERTTISTGLPTVYWRLLNQGTPKSKATTAQVTENTGNLTARSEVDKDEAMLNGNVNSYRLSEAEQFLEAMSQEMASTMIYGSAANPEEFIGLAPRYSDTSAANGDNILDAGGTGSDNSSIWLVGWGPRQIFGVFPKGSKAGLNHEDLGEGDAFDSSNNRFRAFMDLYQWKNGLVVKDWRYAVRIANIDISSLIAQSGTQELTDATNIIRMMARSIDRLPSISAVRPSFYMNRTCASMLRVIAMDKGTAAVTVDPGINQFGKTIHQLKFLGVPIGITDALTIAEAQVT